MKPGVAARLRAAQLVVRVVDEGAHANVLLATAGDIPEAERATIHRLVMDTLRWMPAVDACLADASARPLGDLDPLVRSLLRVGGTELHRGGAPHGVVHSTVEAVRRGGEPKAAGFVNAVLRRLVREEPWEALPGGLALGAPAWIHRRLVAAWGADEAERFLAATLEPPAIGVRVRPGGPVLEDPVPGIAGAGYVAERSAVVAAGAGLMVMDPASTAVAHALEARPGDTILDVAAAPGNKTTALWDAMEGTGRLVATDAHRRRVRSAARRAARLGVGAHWVIADGVQPPFRPSGFDRVLLDAPCSGLGTVRRRPEIKLRLDENAPQRMAALQRDLVAASLPLVRPGGRLVYSVCTVFPEETVEVADAFGGRPPDGLPGRPWGSGLLLGPHLTGTDGMFISVIEV